MFIRSNNEITYTAADIEAMVEIPTGNWLMKYDELKGYYLESTPTFKFPPKIYGNSEKLASRYLNTFDDKDGNVGVLLSGNKGTGKSVLAKLTAHKSELAVIIITEPFVDENFKSLLSNIAQKCVIFIDEFEKVYYENEMQNTFLSILDGVFEGKKLFIFTSNEKGKVNQYMLNRPGRILYLEEYDSLDEGIIKDVIKDNLENKKNKKDLEHVLNLLGNITMDVLISIISEMNRYNETATESIKYLNIKPEDSTYSVDVFQGKTKLGESIIYTHPLVEQKIEMELFLDDISVYKQPEDVMVVDSPAKVSITDLTENCVDRSIETVVKSSERKSEWIYLTIDILKSKVVHKGKDIIIETDNDMRYKFSNKPVYTYIF